MKIVFLGNNWLGWKVIEHLKILKEDIVSIVLHSASKRTFGNHIKNSVDINTEYVFEDHQLKNPSVIQTIADLEPDMAISALFGSILKKELIQIFPKGVINIHPAYLPFNRGAYPNVWSIVDRTIAGATIHFIDEGIDTGDIIFQSKIRIEPFDTGQSVYKKLENASLDLFRQAWPKIKKGDFVRKKQDVNQGTFHRKEDVDDIDEIDTQKKYKAMDLIDLVRARTFPPYQGAFYRHDGKKIFLRLELIPENNLKR